MKVLVGPCKAEKAEGLPLPLPDEAISKLVLADLGGMAVICGEFDLDAPFVSCDVDGVGVGVAGERLKEIASASIAPGGLLFDWRGVPVVYANPVAEELALEGGVEMAPVADLAGKGAPGGLKTLLLLLPLPHAPFDTDGDGL